MNKTFVSAEAALKVALKCKPSAPPALTKYHVYSWYEHTDITDPYMLAAAALEYGDYNNEIDFEQLISNAIKYFPERGFNPLY